MAPSKVPEPRSSAGPGCWQCAICGRVNRDGSGSCDRCDDQERIPNLSFVDVESPE